VIRVDLEHTNGTWAQAEVIGHLATNRLGNIKRFKILTALAVRPSLDVLKLLRAEVLNGQDPRLLATCHVVVRT
jgi:hypothetical protein